AFPVESVLRVTRADARVQTELSTRFYAPGNGHLRVSVSEGTSEVAKDVVWAVFSPDSLELGAEMLAARRAALKLRWALLNRVDIPQKRLEIEKKLRETRRLQAMTQRFEADEEAWQTLS